MKKILNSRWFVLLALLATIIPLSFSCKEDRVMPKLETGKENCDPKGAIVSLDLSSSIEELRALQLEKNTAPNSDEDDLKIKWQAGSTIKAKAALFCKGHSDYTTYFDIEGKIEDNPTDKYNPKVKFRASNIQLQGGDFSAVNEWYIQLITGIDDKFWDSSTHTYKFDKMNVATKSKLALDIPIASEWVKVQTNGNSCSAKFSMRPLGSIIALRVESPLYEAMSVNKIIVLTNMFDNVGSFSLQPQDVNNVTGYPVWTSSNGERTSMPEFLVDNQSRAERSGSSRLSINESNILLNVENDGIKFENNATGESQVSKPVYFWAMPNKNVNVHKQNRYFFGNLRISTDNSEFGLYPDGINPHSTDILSGKTYSIKLTLPESDLMITELFHYNPGGSNYSMIELYNPTNKKIDLTEYSLIRQRTLYEVGHDSGTTDGVSVGMIVAGFQPGDTYNSIQEAIYQPVYFGPDAGQNMPTCVVGKHYPLEYLSGNHGGYSEELKGAVNRHSYYYWYGNDDERRWLEPGHCIILCAGGSLKAKTEGDASKYPDAICGNYILKAKESGILNYVLAVDNGAVQGAGQGYITSGVMQHGTKQSMVLLKNDKPIDVTGPFAYIDAHYFWPEDPADPTITHKCSTGEGYHNNPYWRNNTMWTLNYGGRYYVYGTPKQRQNFIAYMPKTAVTTNDDHFDLVRKPFAMYPTLLWDNNKKDGESWDEDSQWILVRGTRAGGSRVSSLGTRNPIDKYIDEDFLKKDQIDHNGTMESNYEMFPVTYDKRHY